MVDQVKAMDKEASAENSQEQEELSDDQLKGAAGGVGKPPSGDANPSDLRNSTVDTSDIINPHPTR